jgi:3-carboxy-cis,cis-muconate cycloisomerase
MEPSTRPLVKDLTGDPEIARHFAAKAELAAMLRFERELTEAQAALGLVPAEAAAAIGRAIENLSWPSAAAGVRQGMARDGVPVPALVRALRAAVDEPHAAFVHGGATSQDVVDTGLMLRLRAVLAELQTRLGTLLASLGALEARDGAIAVMAQTRMQAALPFTASDKIATWRAPLAGVLRRLDKRARHLPLQLGGPIGTGDSFGSRFAELRAELADRLGLADATPWHSDRTPILDMAQLFALLNGTLGKIGQDLALLAQSDRGAIRLAGGGGSSAMAHKSNPVGAEALVALGRFNAGLLGLLAQSLIHENERSGAAWTLEWMVLPQMAEASGAALRIADELLRGARFQKP